MSIVYSWDENKTNLFNKFQFLWTHLKATIEKSKQKYKSDKLLGSKTSLKPYWSILKAFLRLKRYLILYLCCTKTNLSWALRKRLNYLMNSLLSSVLLLTTIVIFLRFLLKNCVRHFQQLSFQQMISYYIISIQVCDESLCKPQGIIFRSCLENGKFPSEQKKS